MPLCPSDIVRKWCDEGDVSRKRVAVAAGCSTQTVGMWACETWEPSTDHIRRMIGRSADLPDGMKQDLLDWYVAGSSFRVVAADAPTDRELDANGDGRVTAHDALIHLGRAVCASAAAANEMTEALADGTVTPDEAAAVERVMADAERQIGLARAAVARKRPAPVRMAQ